MKTELEVIKNSDTLMSQENIQNASALLALMHGKSESLCRLFDREIIIDLNQIQQLNKTIIEKLSLNQVKAISTSVDVTLKDRKIITFKTFKEFEEYRWNLENVSTGSMFFQWDFFLTLDNYQVPQRHTLSLRITSSPNASDFFRALLNGGLDSTTDFEVKTATMICKIDFINNTLAEELLNVVQNWNEICETAISKKGFIRPKIYRFRLFFSKTTEFFCLATFSLLIANLIKFYLLPRFSFNFENITYFILFYIPLYFLFKNISRYFGGKLLSRLENLMGTHVFLITTGDKKLEEQINQKSNFVKEATLFFLNFLITIILSVIFYTL